MMTQPVAAAGGKPSRAATVLRFLSPRRIVAFIQIAGGIIGAHSILIQLVRSWGSALPFVTWLVFGAVLLLFGLSIVAGFQLLRGSRAGYILSVLAQALQVPLIVSDILIYKIYCLVRLILFVQIREQPGLNIFFGYDFNVLDVGFQFLIRNEVDNFVLGINAVPLLLILIVVSGYPHADRPQAGVAVPASTAD